MAKVEITSEGALTQIKVDGAPVRCVTGASVSFGVHRLSEVTLNLVPTEGVYDLSDATLKIGGIEAPESLERAMLAHLQAKYAPKIEASAIPGFDSVTVNGTPYFIPTWGGSLPTAEEMAPAIRSVVQSVADNLLKLPVREMSSESKRCVEIMARDLAELPITITSKSAPAGLTRTASDHERPNGRT